MFDDLKTDGFVHWLVWPAIAIIVQDSELFIPNQAADVVS